MKEGSFASSVRSRVLLGVFTLSVSFLVAQDTESYEILGRVIAEAAPRLDVMDLKIFGSPAELAAPAVAFQDVTAELAVGFRFKPQAWPFGSNSGQGSA